MEKNLKFNSSKYRPDLEIEGIELKLLQKSHDEFVKLFDSKYDIGKYVIEVRKEIDKGFIEISFIPKIESYLQDIPFEVPNEGRYKNGMGVSFAFSVKDLKLLQTTYMR